MTVFEYLKYAWPHIQPFFTDPAVRNAVWQIWFNRDYTAWAALKDSDAYTLTNWGRSTDAILRSQGYCLQTLAVWEQPPSRLSSRSIPMRASPHRSPRTACWGQPVPQPASSSRRVQIALAPDGSLYVADSLNHRIQHLSPDGTVLQVWGTFADVAQGDAPGGTFNEPWGVAVAPDGSVYVADTWNYRIQKFTADGKFLKMWGTGPALGQDQFYGPRGLAVDSLGRLFVADTGNKRIVIYDAEGNYLGEFGLPGMELGQLDEPVDIAVDVQGWSM